MYRHIDNKQTTQVPELPDYNYKTLPADEKIKSKNRQNPYYEYFNYITLCIVDEKSQ